MREQKVVSDDVRLRGGIAMGAGGDADAKRVGAAARREVALVVAAEGLDVGLVHRDPVLHPVAEAPEAHVCVRSEIIAASCVYTNYASHGQSQFHLRLSSSANNATTSESAAPYNAMQCN